MRLVRGEIKEKSDSDLGHDPDLSTLLVPGKGRSQCRIPTRVGGKMYFGYMFSIFSYFSTALMPKIVSQESQKI